MKNMREREIEKEREGEREREREGERMENDGERVNVEVERISKEEVDEERKCGRPGRHASVGMAMSSRDCTGVPDETVQQTDGK